MNIKYITRLIFFLSCFSFAQEPLDQIKNLSDKELETFNNLPPQIQQNIVERLQSSSVQNTSINTNDSIKPQDTVLKIDTELESEKKEFKKFGYNFFSGIPTTFTPVNDIPVPGDYVVGIGDVFEINFRGQKFGKYELEVNKSGNLSIPEIGDINVIELTFDEVKQSIKNSFQDFYLSVEATVNLKELKFIQVSILGAVKNPGSYLVNPFTTTSNLLSFAGGLEDYASLRKIELRGSKNVKIDMYNYLVKGEKEDLMLRSGDIIFIPSTTNFILLSGSVNRPAYYEFKEGETAKDLINYAQNFSRFANKETFQIKEIFGNKLVSKLINHNENTTDLSNVIEIFIPRIYPNITDSVYIYGEVSDMGPFDVGDYNSLKTLIDKLNFTTDLYPYFALLVKTSDSKFKNQYFPFSVIDEETYEDLILESGSKIYFFSKANFLEEKKYSEKLSSAIVKIMDGYSVTFSGEFLNNTSIPVYGSVSLSSLIDFVGGFTPNADKERLEVIFPLEQKTIFNPSLDLSLLSPLSASINVPKFNSEIIQVEIFGEISNPGTYPILSGTTLNEIYAKAGNLRNTASGEAIVLIRKELQLKERAALEIAKSSLVNSFVDSLSSNAVISNSSNLNTQILALLNEATMLDPVGRLSGDLSPDSSFAKQLVLQDGDKIYISSIPQTITIFGEVNNPATLNYVERFDVKDYIKMAGGLKNAAEKSQIFVIKANGTSYTLDEKLFNFNNNELMPGDTIIVPKDLDKISGLPLVKVATDILSSLAFSAASLNAIRN